MMLISPFLKTIYLNLYINKFINSFIKWPPLISFFINKTY